MRSIYFDYNATTPIDPAVRFAMEPFLAEVWGNPSSVHHVGRKARAHLDDARDRCADLLSCRPSEIIFTSGGTESSNLAILGSARRLRSKGRHLITSTIEHHAVLHCFKYLSEHEGFEVSYLPADRQGVVSIDDLAAAWRPDTILVSVMAANNEVGTIQPVAQLGTWCRERGTLFHTDAVQWFGKQPFTNIRQFNADLVSICAHKFHGPKGAGLLYARSPLFPQPLLLGGGHENEHRAGTENLAAIMGLVAALERFVHAPVFDPQLMDALTRPLILRLQQLDGVELLVPSASRLPNTVSFVVRHADSIALLAGLDIEGICASSGSACSAGSLEPSHVVSAMGFDNPLANALVRFSLGRDNTASEVDLVASLVPEVVHRVQLRQKLPKAL
jgi:cysteine desulfurase